MTRGPAILRRTLAWLCLVTGVLLAGLWLAGSVYLNTPAFQQHLMALINTRIPGTLSWQTLDLSLIRGALKWEALTLKDPQGKTVAEIPVLEANLDWAALREHQLLFSSIRAKHPRLSIRLLPDGSTNLTTVFTTGDDTESQGMPLNLIIREASVLNASLDLAGPDLAVSIPDLTLSIPDLDLAQETLGLTATLRDSRFRAGASELFLSSCALSGRFDKDRLTDLDLAAQAPGIRLTAAGSVSNLFETPILDIRTRLEADARSALTLLEKAAGTSPEIRADGPLTLDLAIKGTPDNPTAEVRTGFGPGTFQGRAVSASLTARLTDRAVTLSETRLDPGTGPVDIRGTLDLTQMFPQGFFLPPRASETLGYDLTLRQDRLDLSRIAPFLDLAPSLNLTGTVSPVITLTGQGIEPGRIRAKIQTEILADAVSVAGLATPVSARIKTLADLSGERLSVSEMLIEGPGISGKGHGHLDFPGLDPQTAQMDASLALSLPDLSVPARHLGLDLAGQAALSLFAQGPVTAPKLRADLDIREPEVQGYRADTLSATASLDREGISLEKAVLTLGQGKARAQGRIKKDHALALDLDLDLPDLTDLGSLAKLPEIQGRLSGQFQGSGTLENPVFKAFLAAEKMVLNQVPLDRIDSELAFSGQVLTILKAELSKGNSQLSVKGTLNLQNQNLDLAATAPDLDLSGIPGLLGGRAALNLTARGPFTAPALDGRVRVQDLQPAALDQTALNLAANFKTRGRLDDPARLQVDTEIETLRLTRERQTLAALAKARLTLDQGQLALSPVPVRILDQGRMTLEGRMDLDGRLSASAEGSIPLAMAASLAEGLKSAQGDIRVSLFAQGPVGSPELKGELNFSDLSLGVENLDQPIRNITGTIRVTPDQIRVDRFTGQLGDGQFDLTGQAGLLAGKPERFSLTLTARNLPLDIPDTLSLTLNSRMTLAGTPNQSELSGNIDILDGRYFRNVDLSLIDLAKQSTRKVRPVAPENTRPDFLKTVAVNLQVTRKKPLLVDNNLAYLTISPDLVIRGTAHTPTLAGRAQVDEGVIYFQNTKFDVTAGTVDFINPYKIEPEINLTGETTIRSWLITVRVFGTPQDLGLSFSSSPSEPDADILSLIAFGKTTRELGTAQGSGQLAGASAAAGLVANPIGEKIKETTGLDEVDIRMAENGGATGVRVSLGADLSRQLSVAYGVEMRSGETVQQVTTYYKLLEHLLMSGFQDTGGRFGGGLKYRLEFR